MFTAIQLGAYSAKVRMPAFAAGVRAYGGEVVEVRQSDASSLITALNALHHGPGRPWFAFTAGMHARDAGARGVLRACHIPLVVLDLGYLRRAGNAKDECGYYQAGLGRIGWVPQLHEDQAEFARERLSRLGVSVAEPVDPDTRPRAVLVLGQKPGDAQHGMDAITMQAWLTERASEYLARGWHVLFRPHPLSPGMTLPLSHTACPAGEPIGAQFARVREVLTFNSTAGVEALVAGLRVHCHESAHYAHLRGQPERGTVLAHLRALACAQWTLPEMREGEALHFLARYLPVRPVRGAGRSVIGQMPPPRPEASAMAAGIPDLCPLTLPPAEPIHPDLQTSLAG